MRFSVMKIDAVRMYLSGRSPMALVRGRQADQWMDDRDVVVVFCRYSAMNDDNDDAERETTSSSQI